MYFLRNLNTVDPIINLHANVFIFGITNSVCSECVKLCVCLCVCVSVCVCVCVREVLVIAHLPWGKYSYSYYSSTPVGTRSTRTIRGMRDLIIIHIYVGRHGTHYPLYDAPVKG